AEAWASLVRDAGAGYTVLVAKHHDGWAWWDAPGSTKRLTDVGPRRDVVAEYAAACERSDIVFGTYLSLLDWGDARYPGDEYVTDVLHPQALDLVGRYGAAFLWGDGHWGHDAEHWRTAELLECVRAIDRTVLVNDRWCARTDVPAGSPPIVRTFEYTMPDRIVDRPWELNRSLGPSFGHNRAEHPDHLLSAADIIDLYTEVVAKGGHLLLNVGPRSDGTVPDEHVDRLRDAGNWIRRFDHLLARSQPWSTWGDRTTRIVEVEGDLLAIDIAGNGRIAVLTADDYVVGSVERVDGDTATSDAATAGAAVAWAQRTDGLHIDHDHRRATTDGPAVYRIGLAASAERISLFELDDPTPTPLAPLLADASPGDIVQLGEGHYAGPIEIPRGVTLRGLGPDRTHIVSVAAAGSIVPRPPTVTLNRNARIEHASVAGDDGGAERPSNVVGPRQRPVLTVIEPFATVLGCRVDGEIVVRADDAVVRATRASRVSVTSADRLLLSRCSMRGDRWDLGLFVDAGADHEIESCTFVDHLCAIRLVDTVSAIVRGCSITARWWAVHVDGSENPHVHGNQIRHTMRAVDVDGGRGACVEGNAVTGGDSGCVVRAGAADTVVRGNHWQASRIGLLTWNADPRHADNVCVDLLDADGAHIAGP
ncbi:MAG: alpha-L-fucosidase, partial [Actinomycetota bacterium]